MKKFAFLLAIVALFAMSAAAWAASGVKELRTVNSAMNYQVNGKIAAGPAPGSDGDYCTKLYHIGPAAKEGEGQIYFDLDLHEAAAGKYLKAVSPSAGFALIGSDSLDSSTELSKRSFFLPGSIATVAQFVIGIGDAKTSSALSSGAETKSLDVIPVRVEFDSTIEVSAKAGSTALLNIKEDFDDGNPGVRLSTLGNYGSDQDYVISYDVGGTAKSLTPGTAAVVGGLSLTYDPDTLALAVKNDQPTPAASGTKVVLEIVTNFAGEVYIDEDGGLSGNINVSGIDNGVAIGTITIDVIDGGGDDPTDDPTDDPIIELTKVLSETTNEAISKEIAAALDGGRERFMLIMSGDREVAGIASSGFEMAPITSTDQTIGVKVAFLKRAESGAIEKSANAPETVRVELVGDRLGKSTASFDVSSNSRTVRPDEQLRADSGVVEFSVNTRADTRDDDYTLNVLDGGALKTAAVDARAIGDVVASQKFRVSQETHRSSSGGACSMGFGLVAAAGLSALALRKRGK